MKILGVGTFATLLTLLPLCAIAAQQLSLDDSMRVAYIACVDIDDELSDLKRMAGINTAVTAVGTATGVGATVTGFVKQSKDNKIAELEKIIAEIDKIQQRQSTGDLSDIDQDKFLSDFDAGYNTARANLKDYQSELDKLNTQSQKLGNWRTGLLAGGAAANAAGAIMAGKNRADADLQTRILWCRVAISVLRQNMMQARMDGLDVSQAQAIVTACGEYDYVDVSKINDRAMGAMISGAVGAATGLAGTVTSAMANTDKIRNDNSDRGKQKEKNLNTASNMLSIGTTAASATATVFNATQISAIKKVAAVAEKCTGVLK